MNITTEEKAKIFDWLFTRSTNPKHAGKLDHTINRDQTTTLIAFRAWGTDEEIIEAIRKDMK